MTHRFICQVACGLAISTSSLLAASVEWPQFRGPEAQGISTAVGVPTEWDAQKNVAWKADVPGQGWSSPVVSDGKVFLTTAAKKPDGAVALSAMCFDAATGKLLWNTDVLTPDPGSASKMHPKNSPASATPIVSDGRLYVHFGHLGTAALDLAGKVLWTQTSLKYPPVHGNGGSPALVDNELIFSCDGGRDPFIAALDAQTGNVKWKTPRNGPPVRPFSFCTPLVITVDNITQVILPGSGFVGAYDPATGHELWRVLYGDGYSVVPRPVFAHDLLFLSSGFDAPMTYAIRPQGAKGDVTATHVAWTQRKGAPLTPSMLVVGDELYTVTDPGIATCSDAVTGKLHWSHRLDGNFSASPVLAEGRIYFQSEEGKGYVIKAGKQFELVSEDDLGERSLASPAVVDNALFIRTEHHLWKIGAGK